MHPFIKIAILIGFSVNLHAAPFTILAQSGLNVRKEASSKSEKIGSLPFGAIVEAEIFYERDIEYTRAYKHFSEVIEGNRGFWMKITFGKLEGYIFSGFGLVGEWVVPSSDLNRDFRLLKVGPYCDPINYDPKLKWYALTVKNGKMAVKKTEVILKLIHGFTEKDTVGAQNEYWKALPLAVSSNLTDSVFFLIGTQKLLPEKEIFSTFLTDPWNFTAEAKFLFPEETYSKFYDHKSYTFRAFESVALTKDNKNGYLKQYQIELGIDQHPENKVYNISKELDLTEPAYRQAQYKTPLLLWVGDLNSDGLLDFIYYSHTMADGCGISWEYHLFVSDRNNPNKPIKKVANHIQGNCVS